MRKVTVGILVFEGCQESGLTAPLDVFRIVDALSAAGMSPEPVAFEARFVSSGGGAGRVAPPAICGFRPSRGTQRGWMR